MHPVVPIYSLLDTPANGPAAHEQRAYRAGVGGGKMPWFKSTGIKGKESDPPGVRKFAI